MLVSNPLIIPAMPQLVCDQLHIPLLQFSTPVPGGPVKVSVILQKLALVDGVYISPPTNTLGRQVVVNLPDLNELAQTDPEIDTMITALMTKVKQVAENMKAI